MDRTRQPIAAIPADHHHPGEGRGSWKGRSNDAHRSVGDVPQLDPGLRRGGVVVVWAGSRTIPVPPRRRGSRNHAGRRSRLLGPRLRGGTRNGGSHSTPPPPCVTTKATFATLTPEIIFRSRPVPLHIANPAELHASRILGSLNPLTNTTNRTPDTPRTPLRLIALWHNLLGLRSGADPIAGRTTIA